jgi:glycosyltransferase involved in cell wall biosynthesis
MDSKTLSEKKTQVIQSLKSTDAAPGPAVSTANGHDQAEQAHTPSGTESSTGATPRVPVQATKKETQPAWDPRPAIALFCYEDQDSLVGQYVSKVVAALAARQTPTHLFCRARFSFDPAVATGVQLHAVGAGTGDDLFANIEEFNRRVAAAFGKQFPSPNAPVGVIGHEWSTVQALMMLHDTQARDVHLSLHSLERQRSDMTSTLSKQIDEMEATGLNSARSVLIHDAAIGAFAKQCLPECDSRLTLVPPAFPTALFNTGIDPGQVKARYQIGPVDPTVLFIGDMDERHAPDIVMKSIPAILKNHHQARFVFVGDGTLMWPMRVYARYLLLEGVVRIIGHLEGSPLCELIQAADVVVVPSRETTEWWPFQAAWAARKPLVATHVMKGELLSHETDSVLIYPHESSCVWGIERVLYDPQFGAAIAQRGQQKLEERFGWNSVAAELERLLGIRVSRSEPAV